LGLPRTTLIAKMQKLGISRASREPAKVQPIDAEKYAFAARGMDRVEHDEAPAEGSLAAEEAFAIACA
jgi:hypothetical protein